jgi:surface polysaccharide O-acyltransferase-like enzyme
LARHWGRWLALSIAGFVLWALPTSLMVDGQTAPFLVQLAAGLGFVVACASGCLVLLALCLRFAAERVRIVDSLSANAYGIYLVHYVFIVWLQFAMLPVGLFAVGKAAVVFGLTLALSWLAAAALGNIAWAHQFAQAARWLRASFSDPAPVNLVKQDDLPG